MKEKQTLHISFRKIYVYLFNILNKRLDTCAHICTGTCNSIDANLRVAIELNKEMLWADAAQELINYQETIVVLDRHALTR